MEAIFSGFNEADGFEWVMLDRPGSADSDHLPNKYFSLSFALRHDVQVRHVPGKDGGSITQRILDVKTAKTGPLYTGSMSVYCIDQDEFDKCKQCAELGGPYHLNCAWGSIDVYIAAADFSQDRGFMEPGTAKDDASFFCTWNFNLQEYRDDL